MQLNLLFHLPIQTEYQSSVNSEIIHIPALEIQSCCNYTNRVHDGGPHRKRCFGPARKRNCPVGQREPRKFPTLTQKHGIHRFNSHCTGSRIVHLDFKHDGGRSSTIEADFIH